MKVGLLRSGRVILVAVLAHLALAAGCESNSSSSSVYVGSSYYRGPGYYDPWYSRPYYGGGTIIVNPPTHRPRPPGHRPPAARPTPLPAPAIPSRPRPRPAGRR